CVYPLSLHDALPIFAGEYVARSAPDGYTLFMAANGPLLFSPLIFNRPAYHWEKDFEPISTVSLTPMVLQGGPALKQNTFKELIRSEEHTSELQSREK